MLTTPYNTTNMFLNYNLNSKTKAFLLCRDYTDLYICIHVKCHTMQQNIFVRDTWILIEHIKISNISQSMTVVLSHCWLGDWKGI